MKFVKSLVVASAFVCTAVSAQGVEELCNRSARQAVQMKEIFEADPSRLEPMLRDLESSSAKPRNKAAVRESIYFAYNRRTMQSEDIHKLAFLKCLGELS